MTPVSEPVSGSESGFAQALRSGQLRLGGNGGKGGNPDLRRFLAPRPVVRAGERCELCATAVTDEHPHLVDVESRGLLCACRPCYLLFTPEGAAQGKYRAVPERYLHEPDFALSHGQWDGLGIPVSLAFFFVNSALDAQVAFYPSPAGATESLLDLELWDEVLTANPAIAVAVPDVEALLLRRDDDATECFLVPIDTCYELVGLVKLNWKGFDGGAEAWAAIDEFFAGLRARSRPAAPAVVAHHATRVAPAVVAHHE